MSTIFQQHLAPSFQPHWNTSPVPSVQTRLANELGRHNFTTRQLRQRTMPDGNRGDRTVLNKSHAHEAPSGDHYHHHSHHQSMNSPDRRTSSSVSSRSQRRSPSPSSTPLTPEESPPFSRTPRKRTVGIADEEDKELGSTHSRQNSGDSVVHVCICQPDPKIPRPRNAFILYRQHYQASVVAQNPGLANPEISKIIGEQWQNQPPEVKNRWKALAEEEKARHQQQYPTYRYQPKRSARRGSLSSEATGEKPRCNKCGGRSILAPSTPLHPPPANQPEPASGSVTPSSVITPVSRTLPVLRDLSLQSPARRANGKQPSGNMPSVSIGRPDDRDDLGPLSPDMKRRRLFNGDHQPTLTRIMAPRYGTATPGAPVGPGTPFPFSQPPSHPSYPPGAVVPPRRESLPGLRGMVSPPGSMAPPPRPGPGYQQHRLSQGHVLHDRSLTLPPLQTNTAAGGAAGAVASSGAGKSVTDQITNMDFRHKIHVLRRVAPPLPVNTSAPRGPFIAIEGDQAEAVKELGAWLSETLRKDGDLAVTFLESPHLSADGEKETIMARCHRLAAEWLSKGREIKGSLAIKVSHRTDSVMTDAASSPAPMTPRKASNSREIDADYDDSDGGDSADGSNQSKDGKTSLSDPGRMDVDAAGTPKTTASPPVNDSSKDATAAPTGKPVSIIANYSLHASNFFACHIPIDAHDPYAPSDHWQWTATQWRGILPPDLTIFVRDATGPDSGKQSVDILDEGNLFVIKRTKSEGKELQLEVEPSTLRRLGFEVSEWVRAFGLTAGAE